MKSAGRAGRLEQMLTDAFLEEGVTLRRAHRSIPR